jgi:hypothetical protein
MCSYVEEAGNALGATIVHAMWADAIENGTISLDGRDVGIDSAREEP